MRRFSIADWVVHGKDFHQILEVNEEFKVRVSDLGILSDTWVCPSRFELWVPKISEWCWYGFEIVQVSDIPSFALIKICRQNGECYEEVSLWNLEPFTNKLPSIVRNIK